MTGTPGPDGAPVQAPDPARPSSAWHAFAVPAIVTILSGFVVLCSFAVVCIGGWAGETLLTDADTARLPASVQGGVLAGSGAVLVTLLFARFLRRARARWLPPGLEGAAAACTPVGLGTLVVVAVWISRPCP